MMTSFAQSENHLLHFARMHAVSEKPVLNLINTVFMLIMFRGSKVQMLKFFIRACLKRDSCVDRSLKIQNPKKWKRLWNKCVPL